MPDNSNFSDLYLIAFGDAAELRLRERVFPTELIEGWENLINSIKEGYDAIPPEYDNDVDCERQDIDYFVNQAALNNFPEHIHFRKAITALDREFKELTQLHPRAMFAVEWWRNRIPKAAKAAYIEFHDEYYLKRNGIIIKPIE